MISENWSDGSWVIVILGVVSINTKIMMIDVRQLISILAMHFSKTNRRMGLGEMGGHRLTGRVCLKTANHRQSTANHRKSA